MRLGVSSPIIRAIEDSEYSHIGMFITPGEPTDDSMLIESTISRNGVNISTLRAFKERASGWKITRLHFQIDDFDKLRYLPSYKKAKIRPNWSYWARLQKRLARKR